MQASVISYTKRYIKLNYRPSIPFDQLADDTLRFLKLRFQDEPSAITAEVEEYVQQQIRAVQGPFLPSDIRKAKETCRIIEQRPSRVSLVQV
ncbi:MAG: hypothetical protein JWO41_836 [Candidatus Saccharibacteria bacterium]|nr:hypothetical protein [Candidatus Saccharibacteria bacterium]